MLSYCIDDPSVLLEAETEFLNQMFGDENTVIDKENMAPNTPMPGKKPATSKGKKKTKSVSPKPKGGTKRKSKDSEQPKTKKTQEGIFKILLNIDNSIIIVANIRFINLNSTCLMHVHITVC